MLSTLNQGNNASASSKNPDFEALEEPAAAVLAGLRRDEAAPELADQLREGAAGRGAHRYFLRPYLGGPGAWGAQWAHQGVVPLPPALTARFADLEVASFMGLLPEINHAWLSIDDQLYLWRYAGAGAAAGAGDFAHFGGLDQVVVAVGLAPPRPGVFKDIVKYVLAVATPAEVVLLGVTFEGDDPAAGALRLRRTPFALATDRVNMGQIIGTKHGRIFLAGKDGCLYEMVYEGDEASGGGLGLAYVASMLLPSLGRPRKCRKLNHSGSAAGAVVPGFLKALGGLARAQDDLADVAVDDVRNQLAAASSAGDVDLYDLGYAGDEMRLVGARQNVFKLARAACEAAARAYRAAPEARLFQEGHGFRLVHLAVAPPTESRAVHLVAVADAGFRFYLGTQRPAYRGYSAYGGYAAGGGLGGGSYFGGGGGLGGAGDGGDAGGRRPPAGLWLLHVRPPPGPELWDALSEVRAGRAPGGGEGGPAAAAQEGYPPGYARRHPHEAAAAALVGYGRVGVGGGGGGPTGAPAPARLAAYCHGALLLVGPGGDEEDGGGGNNGEADRVVAVGEDLLGRRPVTTGAWEGAEAPPALREAVCEVGPGGGGGGGGGGAPAPLLPGRVRAVAEACPALGDAPLAHARALLWASRTPPDGRLAGVGAAAAAQPAGAAGAAAAAAAREAPRTGRIAAWRLLEGNADITTHDQSFDDVRGPAGAGRTAAGGVRPGGRPGRPRPARGGAAGRARHPAPRAGAAVPAAHGGRRACAPAPAARGPALPAAGRPGRARRRPRGLLQHVRPGAGLRDVLRARHRAAGGRRAGGGGPPRLGRRRRRRRRRRRARGAARTRRPWGRTGHGGGVARRAPHGGGRGLPVRRPGLHPGPRGRRRPGARHGVRGGVRLQLPPQRAAAAAGPAAASRLAQGAVRGAAPGGRRRPAGRRGRAAHGRGGAADQGASGPVPDPHARVPHGGGGARLRRGGRGRRRRRRRRRPGRGGAGRGAHAAAVLRRRRPGVRGGEGGGGAAARGALAAPRLPAGRPRRAGPGPRGRPPARADPPGGGGGGPAPPGRPLAARPHLRPGGPRQGAGRAGQAGAPAGAGGPALHLRPRGGRLRPDRPDALGDLRVLLLGGRPAGLRGPSGAGRGAGAAGGRRGPAGRDPARPRPAHAGGGPLARAGERGTRRPPERGLRGAGRTGPVPRGCGGRGAGRRAELRGGRPLPEHDEERLVRVSSPFIEGFLRERDTELLWRHLVLHEKHAQAARLMDALAHAEDAATPLEDRVRYLTRAIASLQQVASGGAGAAPGGAGGGGGAAGGAGGGGAALSASTMAHAGEKLADLRERLEVAALQQRALRALRGGLAPLRRLARAGVEGAEAEAAEREEAAAKLAAGLVPVSDLYNDHVSRFRLWGLCLATLGACAHDDPDLVRHLWRALIYREVPAVADPGALGPGGARAAAWVRAQHEAVERDPFHAAEEEGGAAAAGASFEDLAWREALRARVAGLGVELRAQGAAAAAATFPVPFLCEELETLAAEHNSITGWNDSESWVIQLMLEIGVSFQVLFDTYSDLFYRSQSRLPAKQIQCLHSLCGILESWVTKVQSHSASTTERQQFTVGCTSGDLLRKCEDFKSSLQALHGHGISENDTEGCLQRLRLIEEKVQKYSSLI